MARKSSKNAEYKDVPTVLDGKQKESYSFVDNERRLMVKQSNQLIQKFRHDLSNRTQYRMTMYLIAHAYNFDDNLIYWFDIKDFCRCCGIDEDSGGNYRHLKDEMHKLRQKAVWFDVYGDHDVETMLAIVDHCWVYKKSGKIKVEIDYQMKPYILDLKRNWEENGIPYTQYLFLNTLPMKSLYSARLYELLLSWKKYADNNDGYIPAYDIDELKQLIDATTYTRYQDLRRFVLETAKREINQYCNDINMDYTAEKDGGRAYKYIVFRITNKTVPEKLAAEKGTLTELDGTIHTWDKTTKGGEKE